MTSTAIQEQIQEQIKALKAATDKAVESKEAAIKYLTESGIIRKEEELRNLNKDQKA